VGLGVGQKVGVATGLSVGGKVGVATGLCVVPPPPVRGQILQPPRTTLPSLSNEMDVIWEVASISVTIVAALPE
jgi:hypothetical protein